ncbi:hypothetical protein GCM10027591_03800 [Zhihengliuella somnathii]
MSGCGEPTAHERRFLARGFGRRLREARQARCMSQARVAYLAGVSPALVSYLETGWRRPGESSLIDVAKVLGQEEWPELAAELRELAGDSWRPGWNRAPGLRRGQPRTSQLRMLQDTWLAAFVGAISIIDVVVIAEREPDFPVGELQRAYMAAQALLTQAGEAQDRQRELAGVVMAFQSTPEADRELFREALERRKHLSAKQEREG